MTIRAAAAFALLVVVSACRATEIEMTGAQRAEIEDAVRAAANAQNNDWESQQDMDTYLSHHSDWAFGAWPAATSLDDLRARQTRVWEQWDWKTTDPIDWEIRVLAPNVAAARAVYRSTRTSADGTVEVFQRRQAEVWILEDGRWKLLIGKDAGTRIDE